MTDMKLAVIPDSSSYSAQLGSGVVSTKLNGGASRYRTDVIGSTSLVDVSWICGPNTYKYLSAFYRKRTKEGALPFQVQLIVDDSDLKWYTCHFVPNSFKLTDQKGMTFWVSAQLEAEANVRDDSLFEDELIIYEEYGTEDAFILFLRDEDILHRVINIKLPGYDWNV